MAKAITIKAVEVQRKVSLLEDPEVERVSLVQHAANQRPFIMLKGDGSGCSDKKKKKGPVMSAHMRKAVASEVAEWEAIQKGKMRRGGKKKGASVVTRMAQAIQQGKDPAKVFRQQVRREKIVPAANAYKVALRHAKRRAKR